MLQSVDATFQSQNNLGTDALITSATVALSGPVERATIQFDEIVDMSGNAASVRFSFLNDGALVDDVVLKLNEQDQALKVVLARDVSFDEILVADAEGDVSFRLPAQPVVDTVPAGIGLAPDPIVLPDTDTSDTSDMPDGFAEVSVPEGVTDAVLVSPVEFQPDSLSVLFDEIADADDDVAEIRVDYVLNDAVALSEVIEVRTGTEIQLDLSPGFAFDFLSLSDAEGDVTFDVSEIQADSIESVIDISTPEGSPAPVDALEVPQGLADVVSFDLSEPTDEFTFSLDTLSDASGSTATLGLTFIRDGEPVGRDEIKVTEGTDLDITVAKPSSVDFDYVTIFDAEGDVTFTLAADQADGIDRILIDEVAPAADDWMLAG